MVTDFISRNIHKIRKIDIASSCMSKLNAMSYSNDDLIQIQLNNHVLKRVINILSNTSENCCPTSWPTELKRYSNKIVLKI